MLSNSPFGADVLPSATGSNCFLLLQKSRTAESEFAVCLPELLTWAAIQRPGSRLQHSAVGEWQIDRQCVYIYQLSVFGQC